MDITGPKNRFNVWDDQTLANLEATVNQRIERTESTLAKQREVLTEIKCAIAYRNSMREAVKRNGL